MGTTKAKITQMGLRSNYKVEKISGKKRQEKKPIQPKNHREKRLKIMKCSVNGLGT